MKVQAIVISNFMCLLNSFVFQGKFPIFLCSWLEKKGFKLVLHVDKTITLNLAMLTALMQYHLNTAILFLLLG